MNPNYLDFEQPIAELEMKIEELKSVVDDSEINISDEIDRLKSKSHKLTQSIYSGLSPWDIVRVARHPLRPYSLDYIPCCASSPAQHHLQAPSLYHLRPCARLRHFCMLY